MADHPGADGTAAPGQGLAGPVRQRLIEAMARRAAVQQGEARRLLEARVAAWAAPSGSPGPVAPGGPLAAAPAGPLATLVAELDGRRCAHAASRCASSPVTATAAYPAGPGAPSAAQPPGLGYFRATWSRLQAEQRLAQSQARLPGNAGPLNSQHLVHRALLLMHEAAPDTLQHFMAQIDALLWLERVSEAAGPSGGRA